MQQLALPGHSQTRGNRKKRQPFRCPTLHELTQAALIGTSYLLPKHCGDSTIHAQNTATLKYQNTDIGDTYQPLRKNQLHEEKILIRFVAMVYNRNACCGEVLPYHHLSHRCLLLVTEALQHQASKQWHGRVERIAVLLHRPVTESIQRPGHNSVSLLSLTATFTTALRQNTTGARSSRT